MHRRQATCSPTRNAGCLAATLSAPGLASPHVRCVRRSGSRRPSGTVAHGRRVDDAPHEALGMSSPPPSSDSSSEDSDDSGAERRRRVASITTHVSAEATRREAAARTEEQRQSKRGDAQEEAATRDDRVFQKQAAALLHRYLDQHLDTAAPKDMASAGEGDHDDAAADFRFFAAVPRGAPVVPGHGLLARESAGDGAGRVCRSEARRRARPRKRLQSDSEDEDKVIARATQVAVDAASIVAAAARAAAAAAAQLQSRPDDSDVVVIDKTPPVRSARPPAKAADQSAQAASGPKLSQRAKKKAKLMAAAQTATGAACDE